MKENTEKDIVDLELEHDAKIIAQQQFIGRLMLMVIFVGVIMFFTFYPIITYGIDHESWYTPQEHCQRIEKRAKERYLGKELVLNQGVITDLEVYPLYNAKDECEYYLIEFAPRGHVYVRVNDEPLRFAYWRSMYALSFEYYHNNKWSRYRTSNDEQSDITWGQYEYDNGQLSEEYYELDVDGEIVKREESPYKSADALGEKLYLIKLKKDKKVYIPMIKKDGEFYNLISMKTNDETAHQNISFYMCSEFDL